MTTGRRRIDFPANDGRARLVISWDSAGHPDQDDALADEIVEHAFKWLDGYSPDASVALTGPTSDTVA